MLENSLFDPNHLNEVSYGKITIIKKPNKNYFVCTTKDDEHKSYDADLCLNMMKALKNICENENIKNIVIYDKFDSGTSDPLRQKSTEEFIQSKLASTEPMWLLYNKPNKEILLFLKEIHDNKLSGHPGYKKLYGITNCDLIIFINHV